MTLETTLYGKRLVSLAQLYELHAEVSRAASLARMRYDDKYRQNQAMGTAIARQRIA